MLGRRFKRLIHAIYRWLKHASPKQRSYLIGSVLVVVGVMVVVNVMQAAYTWVSNFSPQSVVFALGADLQKDENGFTNIVLLGDGGHVRDGADLVDSIMVASLDYEKKSIALLSIPRDYHPKGYNTTRINELYRNYKNQLGEEKAFETFKEAAGKVADLDIQYYLRVDFKAFVEIIDAIDGVTVNVDQAIYDPYYPNETDDGYTVFSINSGPQHLDGETALKFVRSRKTTSDFDRAARQQKLLEAIYQKALSESTLRSPSTIKDIYNSVKENINTDLTTREMISLAEFAKYLDHSRIIRKVIHDDPGQEGGFLYTPPREEYGGAFVLIPFGENLNLIHRYAQLIFHNREVYYNPAKIAVYNATKEPGVARNVAYFLNRFGFNVVEIENEVDAAGERRYHTASFLRYNTWTEDAKGFVHPVHQATLDALKDFTVGEAGPGDASRAGVVDIEIILGDDYKVN